MPTIRRSEIDPWLQAFAVFSMFGLFQVTFFLAPFVRPIFPELRELCGSISLDGLHCSPFATCGVENPRYYDGGQASALWRAPKTPTLLDVLGVRGETKSSKSRALSSVSVGLEATSYSVTNTYRLGVASCQSEIVSLKKAGWR